MSNINSTTAVDRLFRAYFQYTQDTSEDTLFLLLAALHSLDDRLKPAHEKVLLSIQEYVALKALRNHFHHEGEVKYRLRVKSLGGNTLVTDLMHACLVSAADCQLAIEGANPKYREEVRSAFEATVKVYGAVVDLNPCIFNCIVKVFEALQALGMQGLSDEYQQFKRQYEWETAEGHSHYVTGQITALAADGSHISQLMKTMYDK